MDESVEAALKAAISSRALAVAIAEAVRDHSQMVATGDVPCSIHKSEGASVAEIWAGLRMEALRQLFNFGLSDPFILAEQDKQKKLLECWLVERPYLEMPQPRGELNADTIQAVFRCYHYLSIVGSEVCDRLTDSETLRLEGGSFLDALNAEAAHMKADRTLIEAIYDDITAKAKSIALSARFGPHWEAGIKHVRNRLLSGGNDVAAFDNLTQRLLAAKTPDEFAASGETD